MEPCFLRSAVRCRRQSSTRTLTRSLDTEQRARTLATGPTQTRYHKHKLGRKCEVVSGAATAATAAWNTLQKISVLISNLRRPARPGAHSPPSLQREIFSQRSSAHEWSDTAHSDMTREPLHLLSPADTNCAGAGIKSPAARPGAHSPPSLQREIFSQRSSAHEWSDTAHSDMTREPLHLLSPADTNCAGAGIKSPAARPGTHSPPSLQREIISQRLTCLAAAAARHCL